MATMLIPVLFTIAMIICLASSIWLVLHLTAVTALFHGKGQIIASRRRPRVPPALVMLHLAAFGVSLAVVLGLQVWATNV